MSAPFFTVAIPLYNKEQSIQRTIESVLNQTFKDFELVIVDDGSSDCSTDIVLSFNDPRLRLIRQANGGVSSARNHAMNVAMSNYICFLDADDEFDSTYLEVMYKLISAANRASFFSIKYREVNESGEVFHHDSNFPEGFMGYVDDFFKAFTNRGVLNSSNVCVKKSVLSQISGFPNGVHIGEDIYTWLRLADICQYAYANTERVTIHRDAENRACMRKEQEIPYHIGKILGADGIYDFKDINRERVVAFVASNAVLHVAGAVLNGNRRMAFKMSRMLFQVSYLQWMKAVLLVVMPRFILRIAKFIRNHK